MPGGLQRSAAPHRTDGMNAVIIVFPGSNCDRDVAVALEQGTGRKPAMVWHKETALPKADLIVLPGGFSYGDYLRSGAIAARSPIMPAVVEAGKAGALVLGICNGFQILTECGLLPGALGRNRHLKFLGRQLPLQVTNTRSPFLSGYDKAQKISLPVAHHDGRFVADGATIRRLEGEGLVALRYCDGTGPATTDTAPNGSINGIAGITSPDGRILGMMPHPERAIDPALEAGTDGAALFTALLEAA